MSLTKVFDITLANKEFVNFQNLSIGHAKTQDLLQISAIENQTSNYPRPFKQLQNCIDKTYVLFKDDFIIGFAVVVTVENQAELHNFAIASKQQDRGLGKLFLKAIIAGLPDTIERFYLEVRVSNYPAIRLYGRLGFIEIAKRKDYYRTEFGREDAILMIKYCCK